MNYKMLLIAVVMHTYVTAFDYSHGSDTRQLELRQLAVKASCRLIQEYTTESEEELLGRHCRNDLLKEILAHPDRRKGRPDRPISLSEPFVELPEDWNNFFTEDQIKKMLDTFFKRPLGRYQLHYANNMQQLVYLYFQSAQVARQLQDLKDRYWNTDFLDQTFTAQQLENFLGALHRQKTDIVPEVSLYRSLAAKSEIDYRKTLSNGSIKDRQYNLLQLLNLERDNDLAGEFEPLKLPPATRTGWSRRGECPSPEISSPY